MELRKLGIPEDLFDLECLIFPIRFEDCPFCKNGGRLFFFHLTLFFPNFYILFNLIFYNLLEQINRVS